MKRAALTLAALCLGAACTQVADYYPNSSVVKVDGIEYMVRRLPSGPNAYQATPNRPNLGQQLTSYDPMHAARNVTAIETVTGCPVIRETIQNQGDVTLAAVRC